MSTSSSSSQNHQLTLKVLRLSRPHFQIDVTKASGDGLVNVGDDLLELPPAFGNIYLGETFTAYLCVNNDSNQSVGDVAFKAELQTATQRFTLADTIGGSSEQVSLGARQSAEFVLHHEIKELGVHILVCSVHYSADPRDRKFFRKFFKFHVLNPLSVKTRVNSQSDGRISLEIQIQNLASIPLCLDKVAFEVNDLFSSRDLNQAFDSNLIPPQDTRQYLFLLDPSKGQELAARTSPNLGRLDIHWTSTMGQPGNS
jgi:hypothetical protein